MCPDMELLSAWADDEVPSPWKERISSHLEGCRSCADKVAGIKRLSLRLRASGKFDEAAVVAKVASRLGIDKSGESPASTETAAARLPRAEITRRQGNFALPIPFAAVAAAALLAVGILSGRMLALPGSSGSGASPLASATEANSAQALPASLNAGNTMSGNPTMDSLVRYLETQNAPISITIQLPPNGSFAGGGAPMIVKTPPAEAVSLPLSTQGLGFVMTGAGK
ncbi:MAG TPA: zf-HC2 domain-containing protein [Rectinemataceae bacterium]|nr:zf-HC2 domain-containing protein [Rectinemataceae bacterium]